jgi:hypothetical protein
MILEGKTLYEALGVPKDASQVGDVGGREQEHCPLLPKVDPFLAHPSITYRPRYARLI